MEPQSSDELFEEQKRLINEDHDATYQEKMSRIKKVIDMDTMNHEYTNERKLELLEEGESFNRP